MVILKFDKSGDFVNLVISAIAIVHIYVLIIKYTSTK